MSVTGFSSPLYELHKKILFVILFRQIETKHDFVKKNVQTISIIQNYLPPDFHWLLLAIFPNVIAEKHKRIYP